MPAVPAICVNPFCLCIFNSGIFIENCSNVTISNCLSGPCPSCGGIGRIPNAIYNSNANKIWASVLNLADLNILKRALHTIERHYQVEKFSPVALKDDLEKDLPELQSLFDVLPKTRMELYTLIGAIGTIILVACAIWANLRGAPIIHNNISIGANNSPPALSAPQQESRTEKTNKKASQPIVVEI